MTFYTHHQCWVIITSTIHNRWGMIYPEQRKREYIEAIRKTLETINGRANIVIVENSCLDNKSYLDQFGRVLYTHHNHINVPNKGILEFLDIQAAIQAYNISDNDIIIKITGRYSLVNDNLLNHIHETSSTYDVWMKFFNVCTHEFLPYDCVLGCYAAKSAILKKLNAYDIGKTASMECDFVKFIRNTTTRIDELQHLGLYCKFAGDGKELLC